jgi:hypothetical protein
MMDDWKQRPSKYLSIVNRQSSIDDCEVSAG